MVSVNRLKTILKWGTINNKMVDFPFLFLFLRSCSCLRLFTLGVFGSEWQENVTGTILYGLCGIPRVFHISRHTLCNSQMQNSLYTGPVLIYMGRLHEQGTIQLPDSTSLFSFSQHTERCHEREWGKKRKLCERTAKQRNVWYRLGLWRWSTEPNVCVCDKTGVNLSSEGESKDFFPPAEIMFYCFHCYSITNINFLPPPSYDLILS